jgi:hypothetical protein
MEMKPHEIAAQLLEHPDYIIFPRRCCEIKKLNLWEYRVQIPSCPFCGKAHRIRLNIFQREKEERVNCLKTRIAIYIEREKT